MELVFYAIPVENQIRENREISRFFLGAKQSIYQALVFEAFSRMTPEEEKIIKALLDGMIIKHQTQQMVSNQVRLRRLR